MRTLLDLIDNKKFIECRGDRKRSERIVESIVGMPSSDSPIKASISSWQVLHEPERLVKGFQFDNYDRARYFINEVLGEQKRIHHDIMIIVDGLLVRIETFTKDVNGVTEQDQKISRFCDEIYDDTRYISL